jgi:Protein of unknown function (DUF2849)
MNASLAPAAASLIKSVISANRLDDGVVVFVGRDGEWVEGLKHARLFAHADEAENLGAARASDAANIVVDAYAFSVKCEGSKLTPVTLRDAIRANGPTIDYAGTPAPAPV